MKKLNKIHLCTFLSILLSGCVLADGNVSPDYQFNSGSQQGVAVMSVSCNMGDGLTYFYFNKVLPVNSEDQSSSHNTLFKCNAPSEELTKPELKIINLSPGQYTFTGFRVAVGGFVSLDSQNFKQMYFTVKPGKVSYLGWFQLSGGYANHYSVKIVNAEKRDISWLKEKAPGIKAPIELQAVRSGE